MTSYLRYKQQIRTVQDADDDIESWITVRGNHIPIKKGQSKEEAVKSFIEHQAGKNDLPQGTKWSPTNKKGEGTGNKPSQKKEKYDIRHGASIQNIENMINAHADKKAYKSWKEEEEYVAEKLKEEGIYAYGSQIKEAMKNVYGDVYTKERKEESKYDPEFETVRKNALANGNVYGGKYTQKSKAEAYKEYKNDTSSKENMKKANEFVNGKPKDVKNTFLSNPNTLKEFANHFGISEKVAKNASEKFGDAFYHVMTKDPQAGTGLATNYEKYTKEDVEKHLEGLTKKNKTSANKTESEKPKSSNKTTFYKNVSGKQLWSPAWKGSGRKSGYTAIENELLTEKEMEKHGFNKESSAFKKVELGKKDHHYMFGARFETKKGDK